MMLYRALGENVYQFGPAAGSSPGIQFETMVNVLGLSGLRNAYRSVLSAVGSSEISGASRWLDALLELGARRPMKSASRVIPAAARQTIANFRIVRLFLQTGRGRGVRAAVGCRSFAGPRDSVRSGSRGRSDVEADVQHVPVAHNVRLALEPLPASPRRLGVRARLDQIAPV